MLKGVARNLGYDVRVRRYHFVDAMEDQKRVLAAVSRPLVILDVGANEGQSIEAYRGTFGSETLIHAFEPTPDVFDALKQRYGGTPGIALHRLAVSDRRGSAVFHVMGMSQLNSLLELSPDDATYASGVKEHSRIEVETTTLDDFCAGAGLTHVNVLKLDIQGTELRALAGAERLLAEQRVDTLFLEVCFSPQYEGQTDLPSLLDFLNRRGFRLYGLYDMAREINGTLGWCNSLFVSKTLYESLPKDFWQPGRA